MAAKCIRCGVPPPRDAGACGECTKMALALADGTMTLEDVRQALMTPLVPVERELVAAPLSGWRAWRVYRTPDGPVLGSLAIRKTVLWLPEQPYWTAACALAGSRILHESPEATCACGFWLLKEQGALAQVMARYFDFPGDYDGAEKFTYAYGLAEGWGHTVEHGSGYRVQFARPRDLRVVGGDELAWQLAGRYGTAVTPVRSWGADAMTYSWLPGSTRQLRTRPERSRNWFTRRRARVFLVAYFVAWLIEDITVFLTTGRWPFP